MADAEQAKVSVINRALVKLGQPPSYTIDAENQLGGTCDLVFDGTVAAAAAMYDWTHFRKTYALTALAGFDANGWTYGFALPAERVGEPLAILDDVRREHYLRQYMIEAGAVFAEVTPLFARCRVLLTPDYWDAGFSEGFCIMLAADLAVPLLQDLDLADKMMVKAVGRPEEQGGGGFFGKLIGLNRAAQPQGRRFMDDDPLTRARFA